MNPLLMKTTGHPRSTAIDSIIAEFSKKNNISYIYVTHDVHSGFVTHKKEKNDDPIVEH